MDNEADLNLNWFLFKLSPGLKHFLLGSSGSQNEGRAPLWG